MGEIIKKLIAPLALSALLLTACGSGTSAAPATKSPTPAPSADKYAQTWSKSYSKTTCTDWLKTMTPAQQFAAAADILASGRNKIDKGTGMPSDSLVKDFQTATTEYCTIPSMTLTDATYAVYMDGKKYRP
ncbi:hypothetical protein [Arthrobacter sp. W4I7]|uniref:hypothetical protein n=1 Tax=Arthrobacter sp. W4I7 TaxID=3042296 RepID=UPI0027829A3E|nr:hypothetical protein [Arthrobacter sp. W4I7]MDQ0691470.1 hypothetical protein [Arthrobacter sp. W4I7]